MAESSKLHPRNTTAWQTELIAGNTATSRLESGVGNCFPGLECDIRNLERRFFPHLAVDFISGTIQIVEVDLQGARAANFSPAEVAIYEAINRDLANPDSSWTISAIQGNFGPFGTQTLQMNNLGGANRPADAWTAVRLLAAEQDVTIRLSRNGSNSGTLRAPRQSYLDTDGALNAAFQPGELTQSLCSPWTHDFRDCGCFYWASNHPDIAQPERPLDSEPNVAWDQPVPWQRAIKGTLNNPPAAATADSVGREMMYYEINHRWQELGMVLDGREQGNRYTASIFDAEPFATLAELEAQIRYAAGVELGVTLEYLSAAYSLNRRVTGGALADDIRASFTELQRIAIGEMKHIRAVNDLLRGLSDRGLIGPFQPALQVARQLPTGGETSRPMRFASLTRDTQQMFIDFERPSLSIDGLYGRILATLRRDAPGPLAALAESIIADGTDHFDTFSFIQEWLSPHPESAYLLNLTEPDNSVAAHRALQTRYLNVLDTLHRGYRLGLPDGGMDIAQARTDMLSQNGVRGASEALANAGVRVTFPAPDDPRFRAIDRP